LFRTRTGIARPAAGVVDGDVVEGVADAPVVVVADVDGAVVRTTAEVAGTCGAAVAVSDSPVPEASASEFDSDIAPRPAKTMANAINTIASARSGGPPEVGFG
jgi:hypothetical protein